MGSDSLHLVESDLMKESPLIKRLMWSGLLAGIGALSGLVATRAAALIWKKVFDEDPPERATKLRIRTAPAKR